MVMVSIDVSIVMVSMDMSVDISIESDIAIDVTIESIDIIVFELSIPIAEYTDARDAAASAEVCLKDTINARHHTCLIIHTYEASSAVSVMGVPLGADTATSSPIALSGRGAARTPATRAEPYTIEVVNLTMVAQENLRSSK